MVHIAMSNRILKNMNVANLKMAVPNARKTHQLCALVKSVMTCRITAVAQKTVVIRNHAHQENARLKMMKPIRMTQVLIAHYAGGGERKFIIVGITLKVKY